MRKGRASREGCTQHGDLRHAGKGRVCARSKGKHWMVALSLLSYVAYGGRVGYSCRGMFGRPGMAQKSSSNCSTRLHAGGVEQVKVREGRLEGKRKGSHRPFLCV